MRLRNNQATRLLTALSQLSEPPHWPTSVLVSAKEPCDKSLPNANWYGLVLPSGSFADRRFRHLGPPDVCHIVGDTDYMHVEAVNLLRDKPESDMMDMMAILISSASRSNRCITWKRDSRVPSLTRCEPLYRNSYFSARSSGLPSIP